MASIKVEDLELPSAKVESVPTGSVAADMGLQAGDEIVAINGQDVAGDQIPEAIWDAEGPLTLTVKRGDASLDLGPVEAPADGGVHRLGFALASAGSLSDLEMENVTGGVSLSTSRTSLKTSVSTTSLPSLKPSGSLADRLRTGLINPVAGVRA